MHTYGSKQIDCLFLWATSLAGIVYQYDLVEEVFGGPVDDAPDGSK